MTGSHWKAFAITGILPAIGGGRVVRNLAVRSSGDEWLLQAMAVESSGFSATKFCLWAFVLPLYIPTTYIHYTYGARLGALGGRSEIWWDTTDPNWQEDATRKVSEEARPFFDTTRGPTGLSKYIETHLADQMDTDLRVIEVLGYSRALAGDLRSATAAVTKAKRSAQRLTMPWAKDVLTRLDAYEHAALQGEDEVRMLLATWRESSIRKLHLAA